MASGEKLPNTNLNLIQDSDVIDHADINAIAQAVEANTAIIDFSSSLTHLDGVANLRAYKVGRMHFLNFYYKPTKIGFTTSVVGGIPGAYMPNMYIAGSVASSANAPDADRGTATYMTSNGAVDITVVEVPNYNLLFTFTWIR